MGIYCIYIKEKHVYFNLFGDIDEFGRTILF